MRTTTHITLKNMIALLRDVFCGKRSGTNVLSYSLQKIFVKNGDPADLHGFISRLIFLET
jgi:hypothetical protein